RGPAPPPRQIGSLLWSRGHRGFAFCDCWSCAARCCMPLRRNSRARPRNGNAPSLGSTAFAGKIRKNAAGGGAPAAAPHTILPVRVPPVVADCLIPEAHPCSKGPTHLSAE